MGDFPASLYWAMGSASLLTYVVLWLSLRHRFVGLLDPFHIQCIYLSCAYSYIGLAFWVGNENGYKFSALLVAFLVAFILGLNRRRDSLIGPTYGDALKAFRESPAAQVFVLICAAVVLSNYIINIGLSNFHVGVDSADDRYQTTTNNRLLFMIAFPLQWGLFVFAYAFRGTWVGRIVMAVWFLRPIFGYLGGSKGDVLAFVLDIFFWNYLARIDGQPPVIPGWKVTAAAASAGVFGTAALSAILAPSAGQRGFIELFLTRLFVAFDQLMYVTLLNLRAERVGMDLFQMYFASILKVFGLYTLAYNGAGDYVASQIFANPEHFSPNNNLTLELMLAVGFPMALVLIICCGVAFAKIYDFVFARRYRSVLFFLYFSIISNSVFGMLLDGSQMFTWYYSAAFPYLLGVAVVGVAAALAKRSIARRLLSAQA